MQNAGVYNSRNYGNVLPNFGSSRGQINDLYLPQQYLHLEDEYGDLPGRLERRLPSSFNRYDEGMKYFKSPPCKLLWFLFLFKIQT